MLSPAETDIVRTRVAGKIMLPLLQDDLTDHLCCAIEQRMESGTEFEPAVEEALLDLAPGGLEKIQRDTDVLLTSSKTINMKKVMYTAGLLGTIGISMGLMFKLLHLRGAENTLNGGMALFILAYLPMKAYFHVQSNEHISVLKKITMISLGLSAALVGSAIYFKLSQNIPIATVLLMVGMTAFSFIFLPLLFLDMYKKSVAQ